MSSAKSARPRILHCHSTFSAGGKERRAVKLMNAFGKTLDHTLVSAMPNQMGARSLVDRAVTVRYPADFSSLTGFPSPGRLIEIAKAMAEYDLILTYNWGAMDAVMAHSVFANTLGLPPLVHHEDGFNEDEASELKTTRNLYRRAALRCASALVVPSATLERIALTKWKQPQRLVQRIPNGIATQRFAKPPKPGALRVLKRDGEKWVGTLAGLRPVKQLPALVDAFAPLGDEWQLVIIGEGSEQQAIRERAAALEVDHRVHLPGAVNEPADVIGLFDIFALSSRSEQFPLSVVEAMAAGLPVASPAVGDVASIVASENAPYITRPGDALALKRALGELAKDSAARKAIGAANKAKTGAEFEEAKMVERYRSLYSDIMGRAF
ncbi:MAG: glycosyltransferase [Pseudomonadota bacterium]